MRERDEFDELVTAASRAVGRELHTPELVAERRRNLVVRCHCDNRGTVIVKQAHQPNELIWNDWAAVAFLGELGSFGPRFLGGDRHARLFVMEEMIGLRPLDRICENGSRVEAEAALLGIARHTAGLHAAARDHESRYRRQRDELSAAASVRRQQADEFRALWPRIGSVLSRYGVDPSAGFEAELNRVGDCLADPGPFLTFTVGDMAPSNAALSDAGPVLFDFEYAGYRHAFYDQLLWLIICPFPDDVADAAESAYRETLAQTLPEARDHAKYFQAVAAIAAHHLFWSITWQLDAVYDADQPWVGEMGTRLAYLHKTRSFLRLSRRTDAWPALTDTADQLLARLRDRFREVDESTPIWPAFA